MSHTPMTAPAQTSSFPTKEKNENLELVPAGMHAAIIYGVINVGTQDGEYQGKATANNKLKLVFEIPGHRQLYWKEDTVPSPSAMIMDFNYSVSKNNKSGKKSKLLELIETLYRPLQQSQYLSFDISQLAGLKVFITVAHYTKMDGQEGAKIVSVSPLNPQFVNPDSLILTNKILIYSVQMGYENMSFASLPYFYRGLIKESHEGKAHIAAGGRFSKLDENGNLTFDDGSNDMRSAPLGKLVMVNPQYSYEQLKGAGWTDQAMIDNGYARREAPQAIPVPAPIPHPAIPQQIVNPPNAGLLPPQQAIPQAQPLVPQSPMAPMSMDPQMPLAHTNPTQPMLTMLDKSATYEAFIANGWTDALLIERGKAIMMPAANTVFPPTPIAQPLPPQPMAPQVPQAQIPQAQIPVQQIPQGIPAPQPSAAALFSQTPVAPVQQMGIPQAPIPPAPLSSFEQPSAMGTEAPPDDLPF